jgi:hypothetical protein
MLASVDSLAIPTRRAFATLAASNCRPTPHRLQPFPAVRQSDPGGPNEYNTPVPLLGKNASRAS